MKGRCATQFKLGSDGQALAVNRKKDVPKVRSCPSRPFFLPVASKGLEFKGNGDLFDNQGDLFVHVVCVVTFQENSYILKCAPEFLDVRLWFAGAVFGSDAAQVFIASVCITRLG